MFPLWFSLSPLFHFSTFSSFPNTFSHSQFTVGVFEKRKRSAKRKNFRRQEEGAGGGTEVTPEPGIEGAGEGGEPEFAPEPGRCVDTCSIETYEANRETNNVCYGKLRPNSEILSLTSSVIH